mgnify:CR=1 FL=1|jgi:hypothetical protein
MPTLRDQVIRVAQENPELRQYLVPLLRRTAMEHPTEDARKNYLRKHPNANPKNHMVKKPGGSGGRMDEKKLDAVHRKLQNLNFGPGPSVQVLDRSRESKGGTGLTIQDNSIYKNDRASEREKTKAIDRTRNAIKKALGKDAGQFDIEIEVDHSKNHIWAWVNPKKVDTKRTEKPKAVTPKKPPEEVAPEKKSPKPKTPKGSPLKIDVSGFSREDKKSLDGLWRNAQERATPEAKALRKALKGKELNSKEQRHLREGMEQKRKRLEKTVYDLQGYSGTQEMVKETKATLGQIKKLEALIDTPSGKS